MARIATLLFPALPACIAPALPTVASAAERDDAELMPGRENVETTDSGFRVAG